MRIEQLQDAARAVSIANQADVTTIVNALRCTPVEACVLLEHLEEHGVVSTPYGREGRKVLILSPRDFPAALRRSAR